MSAQISSQILEPTLSAINPLIKTRLMPTPQPGPWIERPHLIDSVIDAVSQQAVLICAPAGYGKTLLMSQVFKRLSDAGENVAWVSFDRQDADPQNFVFYLMAALRRVLPEFGAEFFQLIQEQVGSGVDFYLDTALAELSSLDKSVFICLDDLHNAMADLLPEVLEKLIRYSSHSLHYIVTARERKQFAFWQLQAENRLHVIDAEMLAFNRQETQNYFSSCAKLNLDKHQVDAIFSATEGWCMGLQLARLALTRSDDPDRVVKEFSGRNVDVSGYLLQSVLDAQKPHVRQFLLKTSILDRLCSQNCDALLDDSESSKILEFLEQSNLFLIRLDADGTWFRYHHLFQDFLQKQLQIAFPSEVSSLQRAASLWFQTHHFPEEALGLARATGDVHFIVRILAATCDTLAYSGNHRIFRAVVDLVPQKMLAEFPHIALEQVWLEVMSWNFREARYLLELVTNSQTTDDESKSLAQALMHRHLMLAFHHGEIKEAAKLCDTWLDQYRENRGYVTGSVYSVLLLSRSYLLDNVGVELVSQKACRFYPTDGRRNDSAMVWHYCIIGLTYEIRGDISAALRAYTEAMQRSKNLIGASPGVVAMPAIFIAQIYYEQNDLDKAQWLVDANPACGKPGGLIEYFFSYIITRSRLYAVDGDVDNSLRVLDEGLEFALTYDIPLIAREISAEHVRRELTRGHADEARKIAIKAGLFTENAPQDPEAGMTAWDATAVIIWARLMLESAQHKAVVPVLRKWLQYYSERKVERIAIIFAIQIAKAKLLAGDTGAALQAMGPAIKKGAELGLIRTFIDEGSSVRFLLLKLYEAEGRLSADEKVYTRKLLAAFSRPLSIPPTVQSAEPDDAVLHESLSNREREILVLMSQGIKGSFIASRLGITEGTVKWYLQRMFDKLGVRNRRAAIDRARVLGMLDQ